MTTHRVTLTVTCPRIVSYEDGEPCQCEGDVHITLGITGPSWKPSHSDPGSGPEVELLYVPPVCTHGDHPALYTTIERAEVNRRADVAMEQYEPEEIS